MTKLTLIGLALLPLAGCGLYFGDDDGDPCAGYGYPEPGGVAVPSVGYRDPVSGTCQYVNPPYDPYCPAGCNCPVPAQTDQAAPAQYDWAQCDGYCESLDEATCTATDSCRAIYGCTFDAAGTCTANTFSACWGIPPTGPVFGTPCTGLDAQECSRHNDCSAVHPLSGGALGSFLYCSAEGEPPPPPPPPPPACDTLGERDCIGRADCAPVYEGSDCSCTDTTCGCATWTFLSCGDAN